MPCFNDGRYILEALNSALNLNYNNKEIIIIDDGSDLDTICVLKDIEGPNIKVIFQKNQGPSVARNRGIEASKGDYILTHDADDTFEPTFLLKAVDVLNTQKDVGMVTCWINTFSDNGIKKPINKPKGGTVENFMFENNACGNSLFRRECWEQAGGFDEKMIYGPEDWEFNLNVMKQGWTCGVIPEYLFNYRNKPNSRHKTYYWTNRETSFKYVIKKHSELYIKEFDSTLDCLFKFIAHYKSREEIIKSSNEYKLAKYLFRPFHSLKRLLK
ncbi:MAG TPA: glycosyltransferase family 2 protein [Bacteroidales bacterium]|jgi:glycosyltransferase involved in cell wall biosynthesis|nr:glycosyltransferase family 2 protein [Bacteroidales bacterium]